MDGNIKRLPVFVFPTSVKFHLNYKRSHKQLLTLYNPYDFPVRFKVLCTMPSKYTVIDPEGGIGPHACVDIVVRHVVPILANCNVVDKFRITMHDHTTKKLLGRRDIETTLSQGEPDNSSSEGLDNFQPLSHAEKEKQREDFPVRVVRLRAYSETTMYTAVMVACICIVGLVLPTSEVDHVPSSLPHYLHISYQVKITLSYILGIACMIIIQPRN